MAGRPADAAQQIVRGLLIDAGREYDRARGRDPFKPTETQWAEVVTFFNNSCCYCGTTPTEGKYVKEHAVPINKEFAGMHAWGNVVPACEACNKEKHEKHWRDFLGVKYKGQERDQRVQRIETFIKQYQYKPNAILHNLAEQLYDKIRDETSRLQRLYVKKVAKLINVRGRRCSAVGRVRS